MDAEHLQTLAKAISTKLGSLKHADRQVAMYPGNLSTQVWRDGCYAQFIEAHNAYIEYANEHVQ